MAEFFATLGLRKRDSDGILVSLTNGRWSSLWIHMSESLIAQSLTADAQLRFHMFAVDDPTSAAQTTSRYGKRVSLQEEDRETTRSNSKTTGTLKKATKRRDSKKIDSAHSTASDPAPRPTTLNIPTSTALVTYVKPDNDSQRSVPVCRFHVAHQLKMRDRAGEVVRDSDCSQDTPCKFDHNWRERSKADVEESLRRYKNDRLRVNALEAYNAYLNNLH